MNITALHPNFKMPSKSSEAAAGFDIYMPEAGWISDSFVTMVPLGFATAIPPGHVALLLPRSGVGAKKGLELNNTCGVIDSDYRGEWKAALRLKKDNHHLSWEAGERLLQFVVVPVAQITLQQVNEEDLGNTDRDSSGFGSSGK